MVKNSRTKKTALPGDFTRAFKNHNGAFLTEKNPAPLSLKREKEMTRLGQDNILNRVLSWIKARVLQVGILIRVLVPAFLCRGRPFLHSWAELQEGGGGFLDNGQHRRFYSLRKAVKSVQILGPSSGGVPIAVCKFCGAGTHRSRDLALGQ